MNEQELYDLINADVKETVESIQNKFDNSHSVKTLTDEELLSWATYAMCMYVTARDEYIDRSAHSIHEYEFDEIIDERMGELTDKFARKFLEKLEES